MNVPLGREDIARLFQNSISKGSPAQSYILTGAEGMGKKTILEYVLALMLCESHTACGSCASCKSLNAEAHPDVVFLNREKDKASLGVDRVREIKAEVYTRPVLSRYKAVVVPEAHLATIGTQNAMLKMIEEPPQNVVFFLLCDTMAPILQTIISRSLVIKLKPLSYNVLKEISSAEDHLISLSGGNPGKLFKLMRDDDYICLRDEVIDAFSLIISPEPNAPYEIASRLDKIKADKDEIFKIILSLVRDAYFKKKNLDLEIANKDKMNYINSLADKAKEEALWRMMNHITEIVSDKGKSGSFNMAITILLLKCRKELR